MTYIKLLLFIKQDPEGFKKWSLVTFMDIWTHYLAFWINKTFITVVQLTAAQISNNWSKRRLLYISWEITRQLTYFC